MVPYREALAGEILEASARNAKLRLEAAPRYFRLELGERTTLVVADRVATLTQVSRRGKRKNRTFALDRGRRLVLARAVPVEDIGIWYERQPGIVMRLCGAQPVALMDAEALAAWRVFDRLARRLTEAVRPFSQGVNRAMEVGSGADRVLVMDHGDRLVLHVRRLFREHARRALEVHANGTIGFVGRSLEVQHSIRCTSRFGVTALGDRIRFADPSGADLGALAVPWIDTEDRYQLVRMIGSRVQQE